MPQPHGGAIRTRGNPGNRGGLGRPPNALRERMRDLGYVALEETIARLEASRRELPPRCRLKRLRKAELVELLDSIRSYLTLSSDDLRKILDVAFKYGVGTKHVHTGEDDGPIEVGVIVLPQLDAPAKEG